MAVLVRVLHLGERLALSAVLALALAPADGLLRHRMDPTSTL
jgi:hypothetical protein